MPALGRAREQARSVVCLSNLRSINMCAALWSQDNDDWALGASWSWPDPINEEFTRPNKTSLVDYSATVRNQENSNIYACPSAIRAGFFEGVDQGSDLGVGTLDPEVQARTMTYGINGWIAKQQPNGEKGPGTTENYTPANGQFGQGPNFEHWYDHGVTKMSKIRQPTETAYFIDHQFYMVASAPDNFDPFRPPSEIITSYAPNGLQTRWHMRSPGEDYGYGNIAWVDGHASKEPDDFTQEPRKLFEEPRWTYYFWNH